MVLRTKIPGRGNSFLRLLDRYVGIPSVAALGGLRKRRLRPRRISKIGLLETAAIGDTVLSGGVVADLRSAFPDSRITFFAGETNYETALLLDGPDAVIRLPLNRPLAAARIVRICDLDVLIDFGSWPRVNAIICILADARFSVGFRTAGQHRHYGYDLVVAHSPFVHEIENLRQLVGWMGINATHLPTLDRKRLPATPIIVSSPGYVVLHLWPGGKRHREKQWPIKSWVCLIERFVSLGFSVVLSGAPSQDRANRESISTVQEHCRRNVINGAGLSIAETAALARDARLVVSVDTGIMHLAAALGAPVVALHGPTSARRWGPLSKNAAVIDSPHPHAGYLYLGFEFTVKARRCMEAISCDMVFEESLKQLQHELGRVNSGTQTSYQ